MAMSPDVPDDGLTLEGKPKAVRYAAKKNGKSSKQTKMELEDLKKEVDMDDHRIPLATLCSQLGTDTELVSCCLISVQSILSNKPTLPKAIETRPWGVWVFTFKTHLMSLSSFHRFIIDVALLVCADKGKRK